MALLPSKVIGDNVAGSAAERWTTAAASAAAGDVATLKLMTLDVVACPRDGKDRSAMLYCLDKVCGSILVCNTLMRPAACEF